MKTSLAKNTRAGNQTSVKNDSTFVKCALGGADIDLRSADAWIGNLMFALSGLVWALYMALLSRWRLDPVRAAVVVAVLSAAFLPVYPLLAGPDLAAVAAAEILIQGGYQGLVHALCAIALFSYAVRRLGVAPVALMTPIVPVAGLIMAAMWLGERLSGWQSLGAALVCGAMVLAASQALRPGRGNT